MEDPEFNHEKLRKLRIERCLTGRQMAARLKCARGYYCDIENGKRQPGQKLVAKVIRELEVSRDALFSMDGQANDPIVTEIVRLLDTLSPPVRAEALTLVARLAERRGARKVRPGPSAPRSRRAGRPA